MLIIDLLYIPEKDTAASDFERLKKFLMFLIINSMDKIFFQFLVTHVCNTLSSKEINWQQNFAYIYSMEQLQNSIFALCLLPVDNDHKSGATPVPPYIFKDMCKNPSDSVRKTTIILRLERNFFDFIRSIFEID